MCDNPLVTSLTLQLSHMSSTLPAVTVAIYLRISNDPFHLAAGVDRQRVDCTQLAATRWPDSPVTEYVDNDVSASRYSRKPRAAYQRLLADIEAGTITALVGWNFDRVFRQPRELEAFLDLADRTNFTRAVTAQGDVDLTTHDGRLHARIMVAVAAKASDDTSRRLKRLFEDRRERGEHQGSRIVYGYRLHQRQPQLIPERAAVVREVAARALAGETLQSLARWLRAEHPDAPHSGIGVRQMLLSPTIAGRNTAGVRGTWEPILDDQTYAEIRALLLAPERVVTAPSGERRWWLSGLLFCGLCDGRMVISTNGDRTKKSGRQHSYRCNPINGRGCGKVSIRSRALHRYVEAAILSVAEFERPQLPAPTIQQDDGRLAELAGMYAAGDITRGEWVAAREAARKDLHVLVPPAPVPQPVAWETVETMEERHAIAANLIERIVVAPARARGVWDEERVSILWRR
jgi:site-specific DNA recombinase